MQVDQETNPYLALEGVRDLIHFIKRDEDDEILRVLFFFTYSLD